jgi:hypothetical protein
MSEEIQEFRKSKAPVTECLLVSSFRMMHLTIKEKSKKLVRVKSFGKEFQLLSRL